MPELEWRFYLDNMIRFAENAVAYCEGLDQAAFEATGLNYDATHPQVADVKMFALPKR
jgi:uncharacterized protein with HEPN domain